MLKQSSNIKAIHWLIKALRRLDSNAYQLYIRSSIKILESIPAQLTAELEFHHLVNHMITAQTCKLCNKSGRTCQKTELSAHVSGVEATTECVNIRKLIRYVNYCRMYCSIHDILITSMLPHCSIDSLYVCCPMFNMLFVCVPFDAQCAQCMCNTECAV